VIARTVRYLTLAEILDLHRRILAAKASALGFSLIGNHPFVDGNKRAGHAALETFLLLNGHELQAEVDDAERVMPGVAASEWTREQFHEWVQAHLVRL